MNLGVLHLRGFLAAIAILFCLGFSHPAAADTYAFYNLGNDNGYVIAGFDDLGNVAVIQGGCYNCTYNTFYNGQYVGTTSTNPNFALDLGTRCTPTIADGAVLFFGTCNNGREAYTAWLPGEIHPWLFDGPDVTDLVAKGNLEIVYMNSLGDIIFNDPGIEFWYEAVDLTTRAVPEPSGLTLVASGTIVAFAAFRRRYLNDKKVFTYTSH